MESHPASVCWGQCDNSELELGMFGLKRHIMAAQEAQVSGIFAQFQNATEKST